MALLSVRPYSRSWDPIEVPEYLLTAYELELSKRKCSVPKDYRIAKNSPTLSKSSSASSNDSSSSILCLGKKSSSTPSSTSHHYRNQVASQRRKSVEGIAKSIPVAIGIAAPAACFRSAGGHLPVIDHHEEEELAVSTSSMNLGRDDTIDEQPSSTVHKRRDSKAPLIKVNSGKSP